MVTERLSLANVVVRVPTMAELQRRAVVEINEQSVVVRRRSGPQLFASSVTEVRHPSTKCWEVDTPDGLVTIEKPG